MDSCDVLIVGSGPGGSSVADILTKNGLKVTLVEEGKILKDTEPYSSDEMDFGYKYSGLRPSIGRKKPILVEAKCVGGGSEVNAGIYFRAPLEILENWAVKTNSENLKMDNLEKYYMEVENQLSISKNKAGLGKLSNLIINAAKKLNWETENLDRWIQTEPNSIGWDNFERTSMTKTLLKKSISRGLDLRAKTKVLKLNFSKKNFISGALVQDENKKKYNILARYVFLCAGATSSPSILQSSGYERQDKQRIEIHQMTRLLAKFPFQVNQLSAAIPAVQISEYKPNLTIGGSYSSIPLMSLLSPPEYIDKIEKFYENHHLLYCLISSESKGKLINLPLLGETLFYSCSTKDESNMKKAYRKLLELTWEAGCQNIHISDKNNGGIQFLRPKESFEYILSNKFNPDISSIHAFAGCPIGKDEKNGTVNSFGQSFFVENLYISDSSALPGSTCINPQGTVMAVAKMISYNFLKNI